MLSDAHVVLSKDVDMIPAAADVDCAPKPDPHIVALTEPVAGWLAFSSDGPNVCNGNSKDKLCVMLDSVHPIVSAVRRVSTPPSEFLL